MISFPRHSGQAFDRRFHNVASRFTSLHGIYHEDACDFNTMAQQSPISNRVLLHLAGINVSSESQNIRRRFIQSQPSQLSLTPATAPVVPYRHL